MEPLLSFLFSFGMLFFLLALVAMSDVDKFERLIGIVRKHLPGGGSDQKSLGTEKTLEDEALAELEDLDTSHNLALKKFDEQLGISTERQMSVSHHRVKEKYIQAWIKSLEDKTYHGNITWKKRGETFLSDHNQQVKMHKRSPFDIYISSFKLEGSYFLVAIIRYYVSGNWLYQLYVHGADMSVRETISGKDTKASFEHIHTMAQESEEGLVPSKMLELTQKLEST